MNGLDLFSGIGGVSLALDTHVKTVAYCEIEPYCQCVLLQRMQEGVLPKAPIWDDISTLPYEELPRIDIITAGFPCQDISVAGRGEGLEGKRSSLFFEIMRLAKEIRPSWLFLENVPAITGRGGLRVVKEITSLGYDCRWCVISAASVGALHKRERWFLLAYSEHNGTLTCEGRGSIRKSFTSREQHKQKESFGKTKRAGILSQDVANTKSKGLQRYRGKSFGSQKEQPKPTLRCKNDSHADIKPSEQANSRTKPFDINEQTWREYSGFYWPFKSRDDWQETVGSVGKCVDGISSKLDFNTQQLRALGNSVVPQQVRCAFEHLIGL